MWPLLSVRPPATKTLVLSANLTGKPAAGISLSGYQFEPGTVVVQGRSHGAQ